jgi:hypothetical protein
VKVTDILRELLRTFVTTRVINVTMATFFTKFTIVFMVGDTNVTIDLLLPLLP